MSATSESRSSTSALLCCTGSCSTTFLAPPSPLSSFLCAFVKSLTAFRHAVFSRVSATSSSVLAATSESSCASSLANCRSFRLISSFSSSVPRLLPTRSRSSRSMTCPNLSICTSTALASNSATLPSFSAFSLTSTWCCRRSSFCLTRRSCFSATNSSIRLRRRVSSWREKTRPLVRSRGIRPSIRNSTWCIRSGTTTSRVFNLACFSFWNSVISAFTAPND
mmetsp:Transcript_9793/g.18298  ORF Transcript_9793/g.18298 Transcript_9793/m.18298 type:complete len:222 (+) Transcript_9793:377-1042(+)